MPELGTAVDPNRIFHHDSSTSGGAFASPRLFEATNRRSGDVRKTFFLEIFYQGRVVDLYVQFLACVPSIQNVRARSNRLLPALQSVWSTVTQQQDIEPDPTADPLTRRAAQYDKMESDFLERATAAFDRQIQMEVFSLFTIYAVHRNRECTE